jgi:hypothetical protein
MLSSPSFDQAQVLLQERMAQVEHAALVQSALAARQSAAESPLARLDPLRAHLAAGLRSLAFRIDHTLQPG